ncbi:MAG TPA: RES domain-containing protein [Stellaceae bacterium]|nr:RES domain-containing protein [Stellaceae bacterium]
MTPLPPPLGSGALVFWRLDQAKFAALWDGGEGSYRVGGRWSPRGVRAVYAALDPATAILEVAVHKSFRALDTVPHVLTSARIADAGHVHVVEPWQVPNPNWLRPGAVSAGQQGFGDALLKAHAFVLIPSVVSIHSWNLIFDPQAAAGLYDSVTQEPFALDPRLHPAA